MRNKNIAKYNGKKLELIELIYYDGVKLQVDLDNNIVLAWYDEKASCEEWFCIRLQKDMLVKYLSNKLSLLDIILEGKVDLVYRDYDNYNLLTFSKNIMASNRLDYELPDSDSFLGFDFTKESIYLQNMFKLYFKKNIYSTTKSTSTSKRVDKIDYKYKQKESIYEVAC